MATKKQVPLCPKLDAEQKLELKSIQLALATTINNINSLKERAGQLDTAYRRRIEEYGKLLKVDAERVEFNNDELKFQLKSGRKGNR
jgi:hypothetical protein